MPIKISEELLTLGQRARDVSRKLARLPTAVKDRALLTIAAALAEHSDGVLRLPSELHAHRSATDNKAEAYHGRTPSSVTIRGAKPRGWFSRVFGAK